MVVFWRNVYYCRGIVTYIRVLPNIGWHGSHEYPSRKSPGVALVRNAVGRPMHHMYVVCVMSLLSCGERVLSDGCLLYCTAKNCTVNSTEVPIWGLFSGYSVVCMGSIVCRGYLACPGGLPNCSHQNDVPYGPFCRRQLEAENLSKSQTMCRN